ncbi:hypothetical protein K0M31_002571 [Melipona bicolor]|uniref:Uncharacterized protein n=1 Tax=Melipona bicolor TaxID=60889 RepID=A0AA40GIE5_9HYME|nr:hypothetical protein K0M31_002571 [Melipona bicolor]
MKGKIQQPNVSYQCQLLDTRAMWIVAILYHEDEDELRIFIYVAYDSQVQHDWHLNSQRRKWEMQTESEIDDYLVRYIPDQRARLLLRPKKYGAN